MARLAVPVQNVTPAYPATLPITADSADIVFTAAGASFADGAGFPLTGREVLIVKNGNAGAQTVTISSVKDDKFRTGDITAYSIGIGEYAIFRLPVDGWRQADGQLYFAASATDVAFGVVRLPALS
jgi:hypothetical protein